MPMQSAEPTKKSPRRHLKLVKQLGRLRRGDFVSAATEAVYSGPQTAKLARVRQLRIPQKCPVAPPVRYSPNAPAIQTQKETSVYVS